MASANDHRCWSRNQPIKNGRESSKTKVLGLKTHSSQSKFSDFDYSPMSWRISYLWFSLMNSFLLVQSIWWRTNWQKTVRRPSPTCIQNMCPKYFSRIFILSQNEGSLKHFHRVIKGVFQSLIGWLLHPCQELNRVGIFTVDFSCLQLLQIAENLLPSFGWQSNPTSQTFTELIDYYIEKYFEQTDLDITSTNIQKISNIHQHPKTSPRSKNI